jgi:hypothetical protein
MFGSVVDRVPAVGGPVVRVPFAVLAGRPGGVEAAYHAVQLTRLAGVADAPAAAAADPAPSVEQLDEAVAVEHDLVDQIAALERVKAGAEASQLRAIVELAGRPMFAGCTEHGHGDPAHGIRGAASVISAELRLSPSAAQARVTLACELVGELPATSASLAAGRIDGYRARTIAEHTRPLAQHPDLRRRVEAELLRRAHRQTATQLRAAAVKAVLAADPASAAERHRTARAGRFVSPPCPEPHGMASLLVRLPAEDAAALYTAVDAAARHQQTATPDDKRTLDHLRAGGRVGLVGAGGRASGLLPTGLRPCPAAAGYRAPGSGGDGERDRRLHDVDRGRRPARPPARLRADRRRGGPADRRAGHLAQAAHQPGIRRHARRRPQPLHPATGPGRPHHRPRPDLPVPHLHPVGGDRRSRPHHPLRAGRVHQCRQPRTAAPSDSSPNPHQTSTHRPTLPPPTPEPPPY